MEHKIVPDHLTPVAKLGKCAESHTARVLSHEACIDVQNEQATIQVAKLPTIQAKNRITSSRRKV